MGAPQSLHPPVPNHPDDAVGAPLWETIIFCDLEMALPGRSLRFHQARRFRRNFFGQGDEAPFAEGAGKDGGEGLHEGN